MFLLRRKTSLKPLTQIPFFSSFPNFSTSSAITYDEPTAASYDDLIASAANSNDLTTVRRLLNKRNKDGLFNTAKTFKFVTDTYLNTNLDDLIQTLSNLDKGFTRKNAFDCLIIHLCKSKKIEESLTLINTMIAKGISVNAVTFHPLLSVLGKQSLDQWRVINVMMENKIDIDITAYNYLLTACCYQGDLTGAARVVEMVLEKGMKADTRTYDALIMGACKVGKVEAGLVLLRKMEEERIPAMYCTHTHVIKSLVGLGCFSQAVEFVMIFVGRDKQLDESNFGFLLNSLVRKKRVEEAKLIFEEMEKRGLGMGDKLQSEYKILLASQAN
ncbi:hypothetical protein ACHQM5_006543 [Ranunculus cassubicifolius]